MRKIVALFAAAGMASAPIAASAQQADALSLMRAGAPMFGDLSFLQDDDDDDGGGSTAVILGVVLVILIGAAAVSGGGGPSSP